jgi:uncharacterized membrane protein
MSRFIQKPLSTNRSVHRRPLFVGSIAAIAFAIFAIAPGDVALKTHLALHGLCAQRPSHSLQIGGSTLPMDARMTGIYVGAMATLIWLIAARRLRSARVPSRPVLAVMAVCVLALAVDGFNGLLVDLRFQSLYEPSNLLRLATGVLAGTSLGVALGHLFASSVWARVDRGQAVVTRPAELVVPIGASAAISTLALLNHPLLYAPFAVGLLVAAIGVFWVLAITVLAVMIDRGWSCRAWSDLAPLALASFIAAIATISALASVRIAAEQLLGLPRLT